MRAPVLAFVYDRWITPTRGLLELRLGLCREYAAELQWEIAGEWVEEGDDAFQADDRPKFNELIDRMVEAHESGREVVCLVAEGHRLSRDPEVRSELRAKVRRAGGWTETVSGENDRQPPKAGTLAALRDLRPT